MVLNQVFHICQNGGRQNSFLCPNGTLFNQQLFICDWWHNVQCDGAMVTRQYELNKMIYDYDWDSKRIKKSINNNNNMLKRMGEIRMVKVNNRTGSGVDDDDDDGNNDDLDTLLTTTTMAPSFITTTTITSFNPITNPIIDSITSDDNNDDDDNNNSIVTTTEDSLSVSSFDDDNISNKNKKIKPIKKSNSNNVKRLSNGNSNDSSLLSSSGVKGGKIFKFNHLSSPSHQSLKASPSSTASNSFFSRYKYARQQQHAKNEPEESSAESLIDSVLSKPKQNPFISPLYPSPVSLFFNNNNNNNHQQRQHYHHNHYTRSYKHQYHRA